MIAILSMMPGMRAMAQDEDLEQIPPPALEDAESMEIPLSAPHISNYGFVIPPGWNIGVAADGMGVYDSNPTSSSEATGDAAQRYSGNASLTYLSKHTAYQADYLPSATYYRQITGLNSTEQDLNQTLWHQVSGQTSFGWHFDARKYPSWGGSAFSNSSFGSLLMELSGLTGLNLMSKISTGTTDFNVEHRLNHRSCLHAAIGGGVTKYVHSDSDQMLGLLMAPDSSTWSGQMGFSYDYQLNAHRSVGAGASSSYVLFTTQNYHMMTQSMTIRYEEKLRDGWGYSVSVGPEFREEQLVLPKVQPGLSLNLNAGRRNRKSAFGASVVSTYQMGQAQGNLTRWTALLSFEHSIGRRGFAGAFGNYQRSQSLVATGPLGTGTTQTVAPAVDGGVRLGQHVVWFANYGFSAQMGALTQHQDIYRQQFVSGLSFHVDNLFSR